MKRLLPMVMICFLIPITCIIASAESPNKDAVLESITYKKDDLNQEHIVFKLNGIHTPKVFKIKGEKPRLVFDFFDISYSGPVNRLKDTNGILVKGIRVGIHNDPPKTRVVVDFISDEEYQFSEDFNVEQNILSFTISPTAANQQEQSGPGDPAVDSEPSPTEIADKEPAPAGQTDKPQDSTRAAVETPPTQEQAAAETATYQEEQAVDEPPSDVVEPKDETSSLPQPPSQADAKQAAATSLDQKIVSEQVVKPPEMDDPGDTMGSGVSSETATELTREEDTEASSPFSQTKPERKQPADPILLDISFESTANNSEMVFFKLNDFYPPIVFGIEKGNPRVVCDYLDTALAPEVPLEIITSGTYVSRIRTAKHKGPDKVRVVLDLVPSRNYDLQQVFFKEDNLFVIIINELQSKSAPLSNTSTKPGSTP